MGAAGGAAGLERDERPLGAEGPEGEKVLKPAQSEEGGRAVAKGGLWKVGGNCATLGTPRAPGRGRCPPKEGKRGHGPMMPKSGEHWAVRRAALSLE